MQKVVIVTGAGSGIGKASAEMLAKRGYRVFGVDKNEAVSEKFECFVADVNDYEAMARVFEQVYLQTGEIFALVNNAGFGIAGAIEDAEIINMQSITNTNFISLALCCKLIIPYLKQSKGRIINIGSIGGCIPLPYQAMYSATKSAVEVFSRALNSEVRPYGVTVTCVMPGDTKTNFTSARVKDGDSERMRKSVGRMEKDEQNGMSPDAVAKVVCAALSKKRNKIRVSVGFSSKLIVFLSKILPTRAVDFIVRKLYA